MTSGFLGLIKSNNRGQFAIEAVLLMTILVGAFLALTKFAREKQFLQNLAGKPIDRIRIMAGYGTWKEQCVALGSGKQKMTLAKCHPNSINRSLSSDPNP